MCRSLHLLPWWRVARLGLRDATTMPGEPLMLSIARDIVEGYYTLPVHSTHYYVLNNRFL
jgi:hypothetical protein